MAFSSQITGWDHSTRWKPKLSDENRFRDKNFRKRFRFRDKKNRFFSGDDLKRKMWNVSTKNKLIRSWFEICFFLQQRKKMNLAAAMHLSRLHHLLVFPVFLISLCSANPVTGKNENFFVRKKIFGLGRHCCRCFNKQFVKRDEMPWNTSAVPHSALKLRKVWMH